MKTYLLVSVLGCMTAASGAAHANLVNGGFESPVTAGGASDEWHYVSENVYWDCGRAHSGQCSVMLSTTPFHTLPDVLFQRFATVPGQAYVLSFLGSTRGPSPVSDFGSGTFRAPEPMGHTTGPLPPDVSFVTAAGWQRYEYTFNATAALSTVSFKGWGNARDRIGNYISIDDVSIVAVPEPGSLAMMLAGLAALALGIGRRRAG